MAARKRETISDTEAIITGIMCPLKAIVRCDSSKCELGKCAFWHMRYSFDGTLCECAVTLKPMLT